MSEEHSSPIKTWKQLVVVVVLAFVVPIVVILLIASLVTSRSEGVAENDSALLARIRPVGTVTLAAPSGPKGQLSGEQVYQQVCRTCHDAGLAGSPKLGDKAAWTSRLAQGDKLVIEHAIKGIRAMPAKGGNPDLDDVEVQRAVVYLANAAGANWTAPGSAPATAVASAAPGAAGERTGAQVVAATCGKCHESGERGAPKIGDRAAWIQREKRGLNAVYTSALKGHAGMPARGGMADLSDVEVKRAVEYMMNAGAATMIAPAAGAPAPASAAATAAATATAVASKPDGKKVFDTSCVACHGTGVAGAPKIGDKASWAPRIAQGANLLYDHAIKGFQGKAGMMPAKGGNTSLPDDDVKAAVDYMVAAGK